jgi:hypothetical protein
MGVESLRIAIALSGEEACFWRAPLAKALAADGHDVGFVLGPVDPHPPGSDLLALLERLLHGAPAPLAPQRPNRQEREFDLIITGGETSSSGPPSLALLCDGAPCAHGAAAALLAGRAPNLQARLWGSDQSEGALIAAGAAALEEPHLYFRSQERVAGRLADIGRIAVRRLSVEGFDAPGLPSDGRAESSRRRRPLEFAIGGLTGAVRRRLQRLLKRDERWRVAWRVAAGDEVARRGVWSAFAFHDLPDDGRRYYADPFVFAHEGRSFVLCEEFPYETGRGVLSVFEIGGGRILAPPRPILEQPYHLSYPMVFARDGAIWMIPESSQANRIELWRADSFPDRWTQTAVLVDGVSASDATLFEQNGRLWLFATIAEAGGSSWDSLHLWSADRLEGPWAAHPANPVLIDAGSARPAGMPFFYDGRWIRPTQDCSRFYGGGLVLCAIDRLDEAGFAQSRLKRLDLPPGACGSSVHTLNAAGNIEAIDVFGPRPSAATAARASAGEAPGQRSAAEVCEDGQGS